MYNSLKGNGAWPEELVDILIMDRMGCNWLELQAMPSHVVEDYIIVLQAESMLAKEKRK